MNSIFYKYLIARGVTNIIDVDGLLYAPIVDLARFCLDCGILAVCITVLLLVFWHFTGKLLDRYFPQEEN